MGTISTFCVERSTTIPSTWSYLDPPFNSNASYNVLFRQADGAPATAQLHVFDDTWHWGPEAERTYHDLLHCQSAQVANLAEALRSMLGPSDMLAYLVMMAPRLVELRRVMRPTGSLYLHCDPTSSHYLKVLLDAILGPRNFTNEVIWKRFSAKNDPKRWGRSHDVILFYGGGRRGTWNVQYGPFEPNYVDENYRYVEEGTGRRYRRGDLTAAKPGGDVDFEWHGARPYRGRHWAYSRVNMDRMLEEGRIEFRSTGMPVFKRYLDEQPGVPFQDVWTDLRLHAGSSERLGFATQKPVALLERIISASSNPGDVVLDPFCGCGTSVDAAQRLNRHWIGIDISTLAIQVIDERMQRQHPEAVYDIQGRPVDVEGAQSLFRRDPFEFERWAVGLVDALPNSRQVGDRGIDGVARFAKDGTSIGRILISVKGGTCSPGHVRDLAGTVELNHAEMGLMVTLRPNTKGMREAAASAGVYAHPNGRTYPRVQLITIRELLAGGQPKRPAGILPATGRPAAAQGGATAPARSRRRRAG